MRKTLIISVIGLISVAVWYSFGKDYGIENELVIANVEALTRYENNDPNISYRHELTPCYETVVFNGQPFKKEVGAVCQPTNPDGECRRSLQWGKCL